VITVSVKNEDERNRLGVEANLLDEEGGLLDNVVVTSFGPLESGC
jgi:negative regulator of sigma E activity